jgi:hypothetical protein
MSYKLARFLSFVLHPVLMPTYAIILVFVLNRYLDYTTTYATKAALFTVIIFNTLIMPVVITNILIKRKLIKSFYMEERHERNMPFITQAVLMMLAYYMLTQIGLPRLFYLLMLGAIASVLIVVIVNFRWKISIHMVGIGGITGMLFGLSSLFFLDLRIPIIISFLVAGILGTARLRMGSHQPSQIYVGYLVGFVSEYVLLSI